MQTNARPNTHIEDIKDAAAQKIADNIAALGTTASADTPAPPSDESKNPSQRAQKVMGLKETDVAPGQAAAGIQTEPGVGPSTNPALSKLGLSETDVAPGGPPSKAQAPALVPAPQSMVPSVPVPAPQAVEAMPLPAIQPLPPPKVFAADKQADPVKDAAKQPGFWDKVMQVAGSTGKGLIELLGDFAAGYSHQQSSPTEQRLAREHALRMQGNELQAQKDLLSIQQGFQQKQISIDNEFRTKDQALASQIAQTQDVNVKAGLAQQKAQLAQEWTLKRQEMQNQIDIAKMQYSFELLQKRMNQGGVDAAFGNLQERK